MFGRPRSDAHRLGGFLNGHPDEVAEFNQLRFLGMLQRQLVHGLMDRQQLVIFGRGEQIEVGQVDALLIATMSDGAPFPGAIDENSPHGFGRGAKKMRPAIPSFILISRQSEPRFVDEGGGLQRVAASFVRHSGGSQLTEFIVNEREQFHRGLRISVPGGVKDVRYVAHAREVNGSKPNCNPLSAHGSLPFKRDQAT
jgi:hypothetical protein